MTEEVQLEFTHCSLEPEQKAIVDDARIIDAVGIDNNSSHHAAQFDQVVPIAAVARKTRGLDAENGTDFACAYFAHQSLESWPLDQPGSRTSQIIVDDNDILEAQLTSTIDQTILALLALLVMQHLARRRLANIHNRPTA